jgi:sugar diacid utilization regulator
MLAISKSRKFYSLCKPKSGYMHPVLLTQQKQQTTQQQKRKTMQDKKEKDKKGKKTTKEVKAHDLTPNKDAKGGGGGQHNIFGPPST